MSRGLGKRQKQILQAIENSPYGWLYLLDMLDYPYKTSAYNSLYRAACRLSDLGHIDMWKYPCLAKKTTLCKKGVKPSESLDWSR